MDDTTAAASSSSNSHLHYPSSSSEPASSKQPSSSSSITIRKDRLYVGNLHPTVDEYTLLQVFGKFGKIAKLDFLFHKTGPQKGKPRGYAFVEYSAQEDANKALVGLHDKLLRGRKLVVTFAQQSTATQDFPSSSHRPGGRKGTDTTRPTTLSLIKNQNRPLSTTDKIAALEAKLKQMQKKEEITSSPVISPEVASAVGILPPKPRQVTGQYSPASLDTSR